MIGGMTAFSMQLYAVDLNVSILRAKCSVKALYTYAYCAMRAVRGDARDAGDAGDARDGRGDGSRMRVAGRCLRFHSLGGH
jgi:hypothetical protein